MTLEGRYAVITGASLGLGAEIARHFVASGASVMLCARGADNLEAIRSELSGEALRGTAGAGPDRRRRGRIRSHSTLSHDALSLSEA